MVIGSPTNVTRSSAGAFTAQIAAAKDMGSKTKGFVLAALACVGQYSHGKGYAPAGVNYHAWSEKSNSTCSVEGLNCWTALLFWAFKGGAIDSGWIVEYQQALQKVAGDMEAENKIMNSYLRANHAVEIAEDDQPPAGMTVFFGDTNWRRPLNHVVCSLGRGYVVSQQSLMVGVKATIADQIAKLNPTLAPDELFSKRLTHISTIKLIATAGDDKPKIKALKKPFWELPRLDWK
jgi:hypothetical protein